MLNLLVTEGGREWSYYISQREELDGARTSLQQERAKRRFYLLPYCIKGLKVFRCYIACETMEDYKEGFYAALTSGVLILIPDSADACILVMACVDCARACS